MRACPTTCARAPHSTLCRSPRCWGKGCWGRARRFDQLRILFGFRPIEDSFGLDPCAPRRISLAGRSRTNWPGVRSRAREILTVSRNIGSDICRNSLRRCLSKPGPGLVKKRRMEMRTSGPRIAECPAAGLRTYATVVNCATRISLNNRCSFQHLCRITVAAFKDAIELPQNSAVSATNRIAQLATVHRFVTERLFGACMPLVSQ